MSHHIHVVSLPAFTLTGTSICVVAESFTASGPTTIVSVAAEHVALFGAARHTWYRNESTPENPVRGVYVYDPFGFHATDPFAGLVTCENTEPAGYVSFAAAFTLTGVFNGVDAMSSTAFGAAGAGAGAAPPPPPPPAGAGAGAGVHTAYSVVSAFNVYADPAATEVPEPFAAVFQPANTKPDREHPDPAAIVTDVAGGTEVAEVVHVPPFPS